METKPIPNFEAKLTNPELLNDIFRKNPGAEEALNFFQEYRKKKIRLRLTVSKITERAVFFDKQQEMPEEWFADGSKVLGKIFCLGAVGNKKNATILNSDHGEIKINSLRKNWIRDLLCYDGKAYGTDEKVTAIFVAYLVQKADGATEIIATLYNAPSPSLIRRILIDHDPGSYYAKACSEAFDDYQMSRIHRTDDEVSQSAEKMRRQV